MDAIPHSGPYFPVIAVAKPPDPKFDRQTEFFLSNAPTAPEFEPIPLEVLLAVPAQPRRNLYAWVVAAVGACLAILAIAVLAPS